MSLVQHIQSLKDHARIFLKGRPDEKDLAFEMCVEDIIKAFDWTHRNFQYGPQQPNPILGSGGGGSRRNTIGKIVFETEFLKPPLQMVTHNVWGRKDVRLLQAFPKLSTITSMDGVIDVEEDGGSPVRYFVQLYPEKPLVIPESHLIGFDVGFGRFDADVKKALVRVTVYQKEESNTNPNELRNMVPLSNFTTLFKTNTQILTENELVKYKATNLRYRCDLTLYG